MAIGDIYRLSVEVQYGTEQNFAVNVFHYEQESAIVQPTEVEDLWAGWQAELQTDYVTTFSTTLTLQNAKLQKVDSPGVELEIFNIGAAGTRTGDALPNQIATLLTWRTGEPGRRKRGRTYLPTPNEGSSGGNGPGSGLITDAENFGTKAIQIGPAAGWGQWRLVVWSDKNASGTKVTTRGVSNRWAVIRGRRF